MMLESLAPSTYRHPLSALLLAAVVALLGCGGSAAKPHRATLQQLQIRSAFDLDCPYDQLRVFHLDGRTKGVVGCDGRLTYIEICDRAGVEPSCFWTLEHYVSRQKHKPPSKTTLAAPAATATATTQSRRHYRTHLDDRPPGPDPAPPPAGSAATPPPLAPDDTAVKDRGF